MPAKIVIHSKTAVILTFKEILKLAIENDNTAVGVIKDAAASLAYALHNVFYLFNPEKIIIFGSKKEYCRILNNETIKALENMNCETIKPVISNFDYEAAAIGAALFAADNLIDNLEFF